MAGLCDPSLSPMLFTYGPFSREAAQDRSPWVERSGTLGQNPRGVNPEGVQESKRMMPGAGAASVNKPPKALSGETTPETA